MTLPTQMTDRWHNRHKDRSDVDTVYWHMLMGDQRKVTDLAQEAQQRLAPFTAGLHMTPHRWLHMTTLVAGPATSFSGEQLQQMTRTAATLLANMPPITITLGRVLYHPEAIMLGVAPATALQPIREAALQATRLATGIQKTDTAPPSWTPHITICYSISDRPAQPLIDALGFHLPSCDIQVSALSLVIQHGPERAWNWNIIDTIHLGEPART
jgi:2'-5' RNA ligase